MHSPGTRKSKRRGSVLEGIQSAGRSDHADLHRHWLAQVVDFLIEPGSRGIDLPFPRVSLLRVRFVKRSKTEFAAFGGQLGRLATADGRGNIRTIRQIQSGAQFLFGKRSDFGAIGRNLVLARRQPRNLQRVPGEFLIGPRDLRRGDEVGRRLFGSEPASTR